jgi:hypothetical protein
MSSSNPPSQDLGAVANRKGALPFDASVYVDQTAALLGLSIPAELHPGVTANFEHIRKIAQPVIEFSLAETIESATTFDP